MITRETVRHLATLSRLQFTDSECDKFTRDLGDIFEYASMLGRLDAKNVGSTALESQLQSAMREDVVKSFDDTRILSNAPSLENRSFCVPQIWAESS